LPVTRRTLRQAQALVDQIYLAAGVKTINEVRAEQGLAPVQGGDAPLVQSGNALVPLAQAAKGAPPPAPSAPSPTAGFAGKTRFACEARGTGEGRGEGAGARGARDVAKYAPSQPRDDHGRWTDEGSVTASPQSTADGDSNTIVASKKDDCIAECSHLLEAPYDIPWSDINRELFMSCVRECMSRV
jgi:hypothetical protein